MTEKQPVLSPYLKALLSELPEARLLTFDDLVALNAWIGYEDTVREFDIRHLLGRDRGVRYNK